MPTVEEQGELLHAKHVLAPNSLGYCGPDENGRILEHLSDSLDSILRRFEAACPFVRMIAKATGLSRFDPAQITEDTSHSWYNQPSPEAVIGEQTPVPDMTSAQAYISSYQNPDQAEGTGLWEAPRGSLFHWVTIKDQKAGDYQVIAPTTWNVSPSGPLEGALVGALVGTPIGSAGTGDDLRQAAYVTRSFDLCVACTVHVVDARGNDRYLKMGQVPPAGKGVNHSVDER